jgi:hypothetical protein
LNNEAHEKNMAAIEQQIEDAHKKLRQKADDTLKNISDNYRNALLEKIGEEAKLEKQAAELGNSKQAEIHKIRADIYKSALDAIKR